MKLGWLWLSILNTTACPSPMSMTPAFSPGPWITQGALVGSVRRWTLEDLYEQCSFHMAEKMPSSVSEGSRPMSLRTRSYSSGLRPCAATSAALIFVGRAGFALLAGLGCALAFRAVGFPLVRVAGLREVLAIGLNVIAGRLRQSIATTVPQHAVGPRPGDAQ